MVVTQYITHRTAIQRRIIQVLNMHFPELILRGSWKHGDFHLDLQTGKTFSDIDLVVKGNRIFLFQTKADLQDKLAPIIDMKISVHPEDYLSELPFEVSKNKN